MDDNMIDELVADEIVAFEADRAWIDAHIETLRKEYADYWIAVQDGKVIARAADVGELLGKVPNLARACVEFISPSAPTLPL